jgi:hypothetical protein
MFAAEKMWLQLNQVPRKFPVKTMLNRLDEIKAMDKSSLASSVEKNYVKTKNHHRSSGNGVYFSVGAIIIIILLLILLL